MTRDDALEIIDAYGADSTRWPADARGAVLALAATDAGVAAAIAEAAALDAELAGWARDYAPATFDYAAMTRQPQERPARGWPLRWISGGALAAAIAAAAILTPMQPQTPEIATISTPSPVLSATADGMASGSDAEAFAAVFTPTVDEEEVI